MSVFPAIRLGVVFMLPPLVVMPAVFVDDGQGGGDIVTSAAIGMGGNTTVKPQLASGLSSSGVVTGELPGMFNKMFDVRKDAD